MPSGEQSRPRRALRWLLAAAVIGVVVGFGVVILDELAIVAEETHMANPWTVLLLPVCGVLTIHLYHRLDLPIGIATTTVIERQREGERVPRRLAPAIVVGTSLSLLGGASVGKTAAALQMGGSLGSACAPLAFGAADADSQRVCIMCGAAAAFSALMFAPVAAVLFVVEVTRLRAGKLLDARLLCVVVSSAIAYGISSLFNVGRLWNGTMPGVVEAGHVGAVCALAVACALAGILFVVALITLRTLCMAFITNRYRRVVIGACIVVALTLLVDPMYGDTGMSLILQAFSGQELPLDAAWWKLAFTVVGLSFGLKGGEVMPIFTIGTCLGCAAAHFTGAPVASMAALGLITMFSACARCPLAAAVMGLEAFGLAGAPYFVLSVAIAYAIAHRFSLYDPACFTISSAWLYRHGAFGTNKKG